VRNDNVAHRKDIHMKRFSKKIVLFVIVANCIFTAIMIGVFLITRLEMTTLTVAWFGFTSTELLALAWIKLTETKNNSTDSKGDL